MKFNAAMVAAKPAGKPPRVLAEAIAARLALLPDVASAEPAGPGFVNLRLSPGALLAQIPVILRAGESYGDGHVGDEPVHVRNVGGAGLERVGGAWLERVRGARIDRQGSSTDPDPPPSSPPPLPPR